MLPEGLLEEYLFADPLGLFDELTLGASPQVRFIVGRSRVKEWQSTVASRVGSAVGAALGRSARWRGGLVAG
jgi:hypothetical protein